MLPAAHHHLHFAEISRVHLDALADLARQRRLAETVQVCDDVLGLFENKWMQSGYIPITNLHANGGSGIE